MVGPNPVLDQRLPLPKPFNPTPEALLSPSPIPPISARLFGLLDGAFLALNRTDPTVTQSCWMCFAASPPYYEGIAQRGDYNTTEDHSQCPWGNQRKLTLSAVSGSGVCLGQVPASHRSLCNKTIASPSSGSNSYIVPPPNTWWACGSGLTPCIHMAVFNASSDYCVLVQLVPRIIYHDDNSFLDEFDHRTRHKREPVTLTLAVILGLGMAAGIGTGSTALIRQPMYYEELRAAMNTDLSALEQTVSKLEESLTSLSEVVMQNRRGLDLLFLKEGGLCAALKEECCFYVDHSGVIRDSMAKLRECLNARKRERENSQGWFESWYNKSPWYATLLSTVAGPLFVIILILTFRPCVINRMADFVKERISAVQVMVLRQQYKALQNEEASL